MTQQLIASFELLAASLAYGNEEEAKRITFLNTLIEQMKGETPPGTPQLGNYSQRDPPWRNDVFAGGLRFETDGCYVCAFADIVHMAGYTGDTPPNVARALHRAGCFNGANLSYPERCVSVYNKLRYDGTHQWHNGPADMELVWDELSKGPVIAEVDFQWKSQVQNQHFVVLVEPTANKGDVWIHDPWDGSYVRLMQKYAAEHWDLSRTIYGLRLLRVDSN